MVARRESRKFGEEENDKDWKDAFGWLNAVID